MKNKKWRLGVPRALFYYYYGPWWETFFQALGAEVVVSPPTSKEIMDLGVSLAVAEACLPVKVYYGHAAWLAGQVDALFVPRLVSVEKKSFICPKLMGLPDMLRAALKPCPPIIDTTVNLARQPEEGLAAAVQGMARALGVKGSRVDLAMAAAEARYHAWLAGQQQGDSMAAADCREEEPASGVYRSSSSQGKESRDALQIGVIGHGYLIYDQYLGMDIPGKVKRLGGKVILPENLTTLQVEKACRRLPKRLYWTLGRKIMGAALYLMEQENVAGLIHLTAFGCGPDSLVGDLAERYARRRGKPFLLLTLDEHTGEAGLNTRLEAFMDMLYRRRSA
ncbi:acyl-CoA dehydratase activase-related protein [Neomoorella mulderi]|uniref:2-hydroxyglutaryl-CoA dehydratase, D-component n=1 Tax=Moorella mulderi DSM 14980 TaxID=1122241 RepID=A0A151AZL9_9FIRM|nr:acyl-CoA dehydratase activase-related protein [Moorella mulderi]KYH33003.1 2-hydroxyglutaryl-CoA dehydratase, D-component [Moorella mulderi DSM 14980]